MLFRSLREGSDEMAQVLQAAPELVKIIGDIYFKFRDFPGHTEIAERLKKMLPPQLHDDPNSENDPEALKGKLAAQQQSMDQLKQAFDDAMQQLKTKQVEAMAKVQSEQTKAEAAIQLEQLRQQGAQQLAEIQAQLQVQIGRAHV